MTLNTLHWFKPLIRFHVDQNFTYIIARSDDSKEELHSYYNLTDKDLEEITKDWHVDLLIPVDPTELFDPELIESSEATPEEHDTPRTNTRKKIEEVQNLSSASKETTSESPGGGGNDEVNKEESNGKEYQ